MNLIPQKYLLSAARLCIGFLCLAGTAQSQEQPPGRNVTVGIYENPPQLFLDQNGEPAGIFVDFLNDVAERESWQFAYRQGSFSELLEMLEDEKIDLLPSVALSFERLQRYDFARIPVLDNWAVLHRREGVAIHNIFDLNGKTVYGMEGGIHMEAFREMVERYSVKCQLVGVASYHEAMLALEDGNADAAVVNRTFSTRESGKYNTVASSFIFNPIPLHFAVPKDRNRDIVHALDRELAAQRKDNASALHLSMNHWLKPEINEVIPAWLLVAAAAIGIGMFSLIILNRVLALLVRRRTAELEREKEHTVEALRAQNLFFATLSHEIRTPLNYVRGSQEILRDQIPENSEVSQGFEFFNRGVDRLEHLFTSLLRFADVDREDFKLNQELVDLHALLGEIDETAQMLPRAEGVAFRLEMEIEPGASACTDSDAIFQIALNLLHNAAKFTQEGQITFRATLRQASEKNILELEVKDTGVGIPQNEIDSIFIPFKRGTDVDFVEEGSGLGLSIVKNLVDLLSGEISVQSKPGEGSCFRVKLPLGEKPRTSA